MSIPSCDSFWMCCKFFLRVTGWFSGQCPAIA